VDGRTVLERAKLIIESGPLPDDYSEHGAYCPYCAISKAKTDLDEELGTGHSVGECLKQLACGWDFGGEEDRPLMEAKNAIQLDGILHPPYTKEKTIIILDRGIASLIK